MQKLGPPAPLADIFEPNQVSKNYELPKIPHIQQVKCQICKESAPIPGSVILECRHYVHMHCLRQKSSKRGELPLCGACLEESVPAKPEDRKKLTKDLSFHNPWPTPTD